MNGSDVTNFEALQHACSVVFDDQPFVYLVNKDREQQIKAEFDVSGEQLPNSPWGLNSYQGFHNAAVLSALNPTPAHLKFLSHLCQDSGTVRDALFHSQIYQAVMRTSLRDIHATERVQVLVPDRSAAAALASYFPGCSYEKLPLDLVETSKKKLGRKPIPEKKSRKASKAEADQKRHKMNKEIKRIEAGGAVDHQLVEQFQQECRADNETLLRLLTLINRNRQPSRRVLETLMTVTKTILATFIGNPHFRQPYAVNLNQAYDQLEQLVERINVELNFVEVMDQFEAKAGQ